MKPRGRSAETIRRHTEIPVIYRRGAGELLLVRLPNTPDNWRWLRNHRRRRPRWSGRYGSWEIPNRWFEDTLSRLLDQYGYVYVIQPYRVETRCYPPCWNAKGDICECSCMGENHGSEHPLRERRRIVQTFMVVWHGREMGCRLIERAQSAR